MANAATSNSRYTLSLLSTSSSDSRPALLVTFESQRYLFNTPESISRICVQNRIGMKKISHVFAGDLSESAGLPGFILSAVETGNNEIEVYGPAGIDHLVASYRFFTRREQLSLKISPIADHSSSSPSAPASPQRIHEDRNLIVYAIPLSPSLISPTSLSNSLKRQRSASSSPPPRAKSPPAPVSVTTTEDEAVISDEASTYLLFDHLSPTFTPSQLQGPAASQWRSLVLGDMFRGRRFLNGTAEGLGPTPSSLKMGHYKQSPAYLALPLPPLAEAARRETVLSYIGVGPTTRGKFLPEEAKKRGVPPGAAFKKLINGERVWVPKAAPAPVEDPSRPKETKKERNKRLAEERAQIAAVVDGEGEGNWVEPTDCLGPSRPGAGFLVLNIPSPAYLDALLRHPPSYFFEAAPSNVLRTVFYFLGPSVLADPRLAKFISAFSSDLGIAHRIASPDVESNDPVSFVASALLTLRLTYLDRNIFRLPHYSFLPVDTTPSLPLNIATPSTVTLLRTNDTFSQSHELITADQTGRLDYRTFDFAVPSATANTEVARLKGEEKPQVVQDAARLAWTNYEAAARVVQAEVGQEAKRRAEQPLEIGDDLRVTPLGTGSAIPSKYRNVSSTLLHLPGDGGYILLDAGEGTWGQIARRFGDDLDEGKEKVLRGIKMIFISHMHQDHHAGLTSILRERAALSPPVDSALVIIGPPGVRIYLNEQQELFDLGLQSAKGSTVAVRFIDTQALEPGRRMEQTDWRASEMDSLRASLGLASITTVPVLHRCRCWGVVITHASGWRVAFSGDTMPCDALAAAGRGASLLIHEATIEDGKEDLARAKGHSTFGQAIDIARRMQAKHLLLTHFSARYPKLPPLSTTHQTMRNGDKVEGEAATVEPVVATAFDMATMRLDEFWKFARYRDAMDMLFGWDEADETRSEGVPAALEVVDADA